MEHVSVSSRKKKNKSVNVVVSLKHEERETGIKK